MKLILAIEIVAEGEGIEDIGGEIVGVLNDQLENNPAVSNFAVGEYAKEHISPEYRRLLSKRLERILETIIGDVKKDPATIKDYGLAEKDILRLQLVTFLSLNAIIFPEGVKK